MAKGKWKKKAEARRAVLADALEFGKPISAAGALSEAPAPLEPPAPPVAVPPPLAPLEPEPKRAAVKDGIDPLKIKEGLGKTFCSATQGLANITNYFLRSTPYRVEFTPVAPEEGETWAEFAYPVIKSKLPDLENNPVTVLVIMTGLILSGKIRVHNKQQEAPNAGRSEEKASDFTPAS